MQFLTQITAIFASATVATPKSIPAALNVTFPFAYMQSAFVTGHHEGVPSNTKYGNINPTLSKEERVELLRKYASGSTSFRGGEIFINTMETSEALADIREMNRLILQVANETNTPPFYGFWIPSRLPGMWWPANYTHQPSTFRAKGLMSNGKEWTRYPTGPAPGTSILNLQGTDLDITSTAVDMAMRNLYRVLRSECQPATECVGPLVGSYLFSEAALTPAYLPFNVHTDLSTGNISDLQPPTADGQPPLLRMGNATLLYSDDKVQFSFYQGPKRTVPLFSISARDSFHRYCASRGMPNVTTLPADRDEFNDDDSTISLPPHVKFVPFNSSGESKRLWSLWEDWVMQTWFEYCERIVLTVNDAQQKNPYFGGAFMFQLAGWYSIRERAKKPVSYTFRDGNGTLRQDVDEIVANWPHFLDLNPVSKGQDLEMFAKAPWLTGFIHEASHGVPSIGIHPPMITPRESRDRFFMASDRHRHFVNAQGTMAREIMEDNGKIFGVFARAAFINDPTYSGPSVADTLTVSGFEQMWNFSTSLLDPNIVSTLGDFRFLSTTNVSSPPLQKIFEHLFRNLNSK
eukprot:UC4_evm5s1308